MSESEAKFLVIIKGAGRWEHMDDQHLSYKGHIRCFLQRKIDPKCWHKPAGQQWEIIAKYGTAFKCAASPGTNAVVAALWVSCQLSLGNGHDEKPASLFHWHLASRGTALLAQTSLFTSTLDASSPGSAHCPYDWEKQKLLYFYFLLYP